MEIYILIAALLALFQIWLIPMAINFKNLPWMMSTRDETIEESILLKRAQRASNLHFTHVLLILFTRFSNFLTRTAFHYRSNAFY